MPADAEFEECDGYLSVRILTCESVDQMCAVAERILEECETRGLSKVLIDALALMETMPVISYYEAGVRCADLRRRYVKVACVVQHQATNPDRFFENVLQNRGVHYRWFLDGDQAQRWLLEQQG
ncbi:MAG: hypothetical protein C4528_02040 [Gammaproteobacteria bacterium]|nr:MAG: hypothetical protein C4528_02040 [Gammaproteobacteria bacterium]